MKIAEIESKLPPVFRRTLSEEGPLRAILAAMERLHKKPERLLAELDRHFDAQRAPANMLPFLATWLDLDRLFARFEDDRLAHDDSAPASGIHEERLRRLIGAAAQLARTGGTERGLLRFLEVATGHTGFRVLDAPPPHARLRRKLTIWIEAPLAARPDHALMSRIIEQEKPAHVECELVYPQTESDPAAPIKPLPETE